MLASRVFALNVHATYACRHSGACCTAGWAIPVEVNKPAFGGITWLTPDASGACPEFEPHTRFCRVHREFGESALPESCRHFPRRALIDDRGTFVTLSHFCPTAAALLLEHRGPMEIVEVIEPYANGRTYEGLDARREWPPLLRPDTLFDLESFSAWERYLVRTLSSSTAGVVPTLAFIADVADRLRDWSAEGGSLAHWTAEVLSAADAAPSARALHAGSAAYRRYKALEPVCAYSRACDCVPAGLATPHVPERFDELDAALVAPHWASHAASILRYLAARSFASWTAYQARGIRTQVAELCLTATIVRAEAIRVCARHGRALSKDDLEEALRMADLLVMHLVDRESLMAWLGKVESDAAVFSDE